jgi:hypothetical protein
MLHLLDAGSFAFAFGVRALVFMPYVSACQGFNTRLVALFACVHAYAYAHANNARDTRLKQFAAFCLVADACSVFAPRHPVKMESRVRGSELTSDV